MKTSNLIWLNKYFDDDIGVGIWPYYGKKIEDINTLNKDMKLESKVALKVSPPVPPAFVFDEEVFKL